jgi:carbonic anhydrase/acetyltransferase-like protein (isoleucine patch superfamily)
MRKILFNNGKPIVLIGNINEHRELLNGNIKNKLEIILLEDIIQKDQEWIDQHQFFCASGHVFFKIMCVNTLEEKFNNIHWISVVHEQSEIVLEDVGTNCWIEYGSCVNIGSKIGNHCKIGAFAGIFHDKNEIEDFAFVGPRSNIVDSKIGKGANIGLNCTVYHSTIEPYTVLNMNSRVLEKTLTTGTYTHCKKISNKTSKDAELNVSRN